jgi:hypothetical protein
MNLYIDKENTLSLVENARHELYSDCIKTMKRQLDVYFNFSRSELFDNEILTIWFTSNFTSGVGERKQSFNEEKFPPRPLKSNSYNSFSKEELSAAYLINDDRFDSLAEKGALLIGKPGEEIDVFRQLFLTNNDYKFDKKLKIGGANFRTWSDLENYSFGITDILIIDNYIFSDSSLLEHNFFQLIKTLLVKTKCKVNIVVLTNTDKVAISYGELSPKIRDAVQTITGVKPNFTLIKIRDQRGVKSSSEHDRTIFTNYSRVYSGDTFNYFKPDGTILTKGREIHISSFGDRENHDVSMELIEDIQERLNDLPESIAEGDKKSNFLHFK